MTADPEITRAELRDLAVVADDIFRLEPEVELHADARVDRAGPGTATRVATSTPVAVVSVATSRSAADGTPSRVRRPVLGSVPPIVRS